MKRIAMLVAALVMVWPTVVMADEEAEVSVPWLLRPVSGDDVVRVESGAAAFNDRNGNLDLAVSTMLSGRYGLANGWVPTFRLGLIGNDAPGAAFDEHALANPLIGASHVRRVGVARLGFFGGMTLPIGSAAGRTSSASRTVRPADAAMFDGGSMAVLGGVDVAYGVGGVTAQAEATLIQSIRVRGDEMDGERLATRVDVGVHVGYILGAHVAVGGDLHYGDSLTAAIGARVQFKIGQQTWIRPGISYVRGFDERGLGAPFLTKQTNAVQVDIPITF